MTAQTQTEITVSFGLKDGFRDIDAERAAKKVITKAVTEQITSEVGPGHGGTVEALNVFGQLYKTGRSEFHGIRFVNPARLK